jgi:transposase
VFTDMENWAEIRRRVLVDGQSKRSVCREFDIHWDTLQKVLNHPEPPGYRRDAPRPRPKLEPFLPVIHQILEEDRKAPKKQRHTARRIFERLRDEYGYTGGKTIVKEAVAAWKGPRAEVFIPLTHRPGEAQVDFGEAEVTLDGQSTKVALFVMTLPYSDAIFVCAFPRECTEAFLEGHVRAFAFFGGVPRRISYDNLKIAVARILGGRDRRLTPEFLRLKSHHLFESHFCRVRRPNEKGHVETLVGYARRNFPNRH